MSYEAGSGVLGSLLLLMWAEALEKTAYTRSVAKAQMTSPDRFISSMLGLGQCCLYSGTNTVPLRCLCIMDYTSSRLTSSISGIGLQSEEIEADKMVEVSSLS